MNLEMVHPGDVLLIWYMPFPWGSKMIAKVEHSDLRVDHCATVLIDNSDALGMMSVYEAAWPTSHKMSVSDYEGMLEKWAGMRMRWRNRKGCFLKVEVWRATSPIEDQLAAMWTEAELWLGTKYGLVNNYLFDTDKIHCSEECGRILEAGGLVKWDRPYSKITPVDVRELLGSLGWTIVGECTSERKVIDGELD